MSSAWRSARADIDAHELTLVGGGAAHVRDALDFLGRGIAGARERLLVDRCAGKQLLPHAVRRVAFSVAALTTTRADLTALPSASSATATPSAGQSSAEPVVTLR